MFNFSKEIILIILILTGGILFRLVLTEKGSFIFGMDSARDFVDVREMVELGKLRLTGPKTAIEGFFNGPFWYYLLAIPYILSAGNPHSAIIMQIILWAVGGFFLLKMAGEWNRLLVLPIGAIWAASNFIVLANLYSFNPAPVMFLTPFFIYLLTKYLKKGKAIYIIPVWILAGLFFNFEMNFAIFIPLILLTGILLSKKTGYFRQKAFWLGIIIYILILSPQVLFDIKHNFLMTKAMLGHISDNAGSNFNFISRFQIISGSFYSAFLPTLMNQKIFSLIILSSFLPLIIQFLKERKKDLLVIVSLIYIFIPFLGYLILPVTVNPWHLGGEMTASLLLIAFLLKKLFEKSLIYKTLGVLLSGAFVFFSVLNVANFFINDWGKPNLNPALFKNEITAIDYVYKKAEGKNFRVYTYLPSIIDYPYQYLIWWHGRKHFGYLPLDYAYAPDKTAYISNKAAFSEKNAVKRPDSGLIFLIKEPDRNFTRPGWEGEFVKFKSISKEMVGPLEIEIKQE